MSKSTTANESTPLRLFVSGDKSQVGKSTICLGILGSLLKIGYLPNELAYIKPVTQCEGIQPVHTWCESKGISCERIGPVVFYAGFTRAFLKGEVGTSQMLLEKISNSVKTIEKGKKLVLIDGVGYPSVGSICGISNAQVAVHLSAPVLLVCRSGVGDAIDSYNLNLTYFKSFGANVLGVIFNKFSLDGYYSLQKCTGPIVKYFETNEEALPFGFMPDLKNLLDGTLNEEFGLSKENLADSVKRCEGKMTIFACFEEVNELEPFKTFLLYLQYIEGSVKVSKVNVKKSGMGNESYPFFMVWKDSEQVASYTGHSIFELSRVIVECSKGSPIDKKVEIVLKLSEKFPLPENTLSASDRVIRRAEITASVFQNFVDIGRMISEIESGRRKKEKIDEFAAVAVSRVKSRDEIEREAESQGGFTTCAFSR